MQQLHFSNNILRTNSLEQYPDFLLDFTSKARQVLTCVNLARESNWDRSCRTLWRGRTLKPFVVTKTQNHWHERLEAKPAASSAASSPNTSFTERLRSGRFVATVPRVDTNGRMLPPLRDSAPQASLRDW